MTMTMTMMMISLRLWIVATLVGTSGTHAFRRQPLHQKPSSLSRSTGSLSSPSQTATATTITVRGGAADNNSDNEERSPWEITIKKVVIALGAFAAQQTLTKLNENGQLRILPASSSSTRSATPLLTESSSSRSIASSTSTDDEQGATMTQHVFNLVKCIVGVGVLSLPAGIAAFGNARSAILPALAVITIIGILSAIGFSWTGQVCARLVDDPTTKIAQPSYRQAWSWSISEESSWIPALSTTAMTFLACLCFSMVLADSLSDLMKPILSQAGRTPVLWVTSLLVLLPLCWMKDLKSLAPFSLLGVLGMVYTGIAMTGRLMHGSYGLGSPLLSKVPDNMHPSFGTDGWKSVFKPGSVILISMLSTAYMAHYNAPKFYNELKDNTIPRFNKAVAAGFGISILLTAFIACIGFATFGAHSSGFVLNNYASNDVWMSLSRVAVAVSLTFSYPLCFQGLREGALDVARIPPKDRTDAHLNTATVGLLLALTLLATMLKDVSLVLAFTGATLGNLLCYIFPALMYGRVNPKIRLPAIALGTTGVVLGVIGVKLALESASGK